MQEAVHNFNDTISINYREISNFQFADDIDLIAGIEEELQELIPTHSYDTINPNNLLTKCTKNMTTG